LGFPDFEPPDAGYGFESFSIFELPAGDCAGGVVQDIRRAFGEDAVQLRVGVGAEADEDFTRAGDARFS
jgi:hypothetical protein